MSETISEQQIPVNNVALNNFWGKAQPEDDGAEFHPLIAHALDVAAVALLLQSRHVAGLDARMVGLLVALHDVGKLSRPFQAKVRSCWPTAALGPFPDPPPPPGPPHDAIGYFLLDRVLGEDILPGWRQGQRSMIWQAIAGHHGRPPEMVEAPFRTVLCDRSRAAARAFGEQMRLVFAPPPAARPTESHAVARIAWQLAGLTNVADWIASRQAWFPYVTPEDVADPAGYFWNTALPRAHVAVAAAGLAPAAVAPFGGLQRLFRSIKEPSPVQVWAERVALPNGPVLAVIEDVTGSGKTEAAVTLAHRFLASGRARGLYVALPTMATATAMFDRLADAYQSLFAPEAHPSLALAHGRAALHPAFRAALSADPEAAGVASGDPADTPAEAHCAAWLGEDRRRALLAQVGVGTIDQALLAVLPVRFATLRQSGLANKVLILDEIHALDPYMRVEVAALLRFHAALGGAAILMSATLPRAMRQHLVDAFRDGLNAAPAPLIETRYPLATLAGAELVREEPVAMRTGLARRVTVTRLDDAAAAVPRIVAAANAGAAVAWVRNTVDDAIAGADLLRARGLKPLLFHARFAMCDRLRIEGEVLRCFGRDSHGQVRSRILVATQVIEQSLDLDFDVLCTDLAPVDLLIQRAGRLHRHARDDNRPVATPELLVISPDPVPDPPADWIGSAQPGTAAVYRDPAMLWRGARALFGRGALTTPDDMRPLIEAAADDTDVPTALARRADAVAGKNLADTGVAAQNVLDIWQGYRRDAGRWDSDEITPTRLEDRPQVTLRLARLVDGVVVPYAHDPDPRRAWMLSELRVARHRIAACPPPAGAESAIDVARAKWPAWEQQNGAILLALLRPDGDAGRIQVCTEDGAKRIAEYHPDIGLRWTKPASA